MALRRTIIAGSGPAVNGGLWVPGGRALMPERNTVLFQAFPAVRSKSASEPAKRQRRVNTCKNAMRRRKVLSGAPFYIIMNLSETEKRI